MLRYTEKLDVEGRYSEVEAAVEAWRVARKTAPDSVRNEFESRLRISLIYHDAALEGEVLTYSEIKAAIDPTIISDTSLIPSYETIAAFNEACDYGDQFAKGKKKALKLETLREICGLLNEEEKAKGVPYRKANPLHRLYYHEIAAPEKISARMKKFSEWLESPQIKNLHPIERAAETHHRLMRVSPWSKRNGRTARIAANAILQMADYPRAVIHSIDRQAYFEALRGEVKALVWIYLEAIETTALSEAQVYQEAARGPRRRRRA